MNNWYHKPENALKRATELDNIGNKKSALELLHKVLTAKRSYRQWNKTYESIMLKYLALCVDLQAHWLAKDGLHQYRNMSQQQAPNSLETVINYLIEAAEGRALDAKNRADSISQAAAAKVKDLDAEQTPESIMLTTMTEEGDKDRTDRELVVPWLKFLWETYRAILDILRTNSKLEHVYHFTCKKAFGFCKLYDRSTEFRRLCEMLRTHLSVLQKNPGQASRRGWDGWTQDSLEEHLQTRFIQLDVACTLELWTEGFKTVEDIYSIMQHGKKAQNPRLMANYYDKLTNIFYVSENYLFHAYAWFKYYTLYKECNKKISEEDKVLYASQVLLAALCIPTVADEEKNQFELDDDDLTIEKNHRMATLLNFHSNPTRAALLSELLSKNILNGVLPELKEIYTHLEVEFDPLRIVSNVQDSLTFLKNHDRLKIYVAPLEKLLVLRLLKQLSSVYHTVKMDHLKSLLDGLDIDFHEVEHIIVKAVKDKQLNLRIDHQNKCIHFGRTLLESDSMREQLSSLAKSLSTIYIDMKPVDVESKKLERAILFEKVIGKAPQEHTDALERKIIIEKRKELEEEKEKSKIYQSKLKSTKSELDGLIKGWERELGEIEQRKVDALRKQQEQKQVDRIKAKIKEIVTSDGRVVLNSSGKKEIISSIGDFDRFSFSDFLEFSEQELDDKIKKQKFKKKEDEERHEKDAAVSLDYITRALREEEIPKLEKKYIEETEQKFADIEANYKEKKAIVDLTAPYRAAFEDTLLQAREAEYIKIVEDTKQKMILDTLKKRLLAAKEAFEDAKRERQLEEQRESKQRKKDQEALKMKEMEDKRIQRDREEREKRENELAEKEEKEAELRQQKQAEMDARAPHPNEQSYQPPLGGSYVPPSRRGGGGGGFDNDRRGGFDHDGPSRGGGREQEEWRTHNNPRRQGSNEPDWERPRGGGFNDRNNRGGGGGFSRGGNNRSDESRW